MTSAALRRLVQCRPTSLALLVDVRTVLHQHADHVDITTASGGMDGRFVVLTEVAILVYIRTSFQQPLNDLCVLPRTSFCKNRGRASEARVIWDIRIRAC